MPKKHFRITKHIQIFLGLLISSKPLFVAVCCVVLKVFLDHHNLFLSAEEEPELVNHHLYDVLQVRTHSLKFSEVTELVLKQSGPPADG